MATISRVHTFSTGEVLTAANLNGELNLIVTAINGNIDADNVDTSAIPTLTATQTLTNKTLTSPKIGTAVLDTAGAELIKLTATGSAVNELTIANAATGNSPTISSTGDDANIDLTLSGKGTGKVIVSGDLQVSGDDLFMGTNTSGHVLIADGTNFNPTALSGDVTVNSSGTTAIESGVIVDADVNASAAIAQSKLALAVTTSEIAAATLVTESEGIGSNDNDTTLPTSAAVKDYVDTQILTEDTLTELNDTNISSASSGQLLIYDGTDSWDNQSLSGDVTVNASGVTAISSDVIVNADIKSDAAIADSKLATISTANKVSGSAVQLAPTTAIEDSSGLQIKSAIAGTGLSLSSQVLSVDAAQTQITSVGTLSALTVSGLITASGGLSGNVTGGTISGTTGTFTGALTGTTGTFASTGTGDILVVETSDDTNTAGPVLCLLRESTSPADGDYLGQIKFKGRNDAGQQLIYGKITAKTSDVTDGTEDSLIEIAVKADGSNRIVSRQKHDCLQLVNGTGLDVNGVTTLEDALNGTTASFSSTIATTGGYVTVSGNPSAGALSTNGFGQIGGLTGNGLFAYGKGSTYDLALANADTSVALAIPTGGSPTPDVYIPNSLGVGTSSPTSYSFNNDAKLVVANTSANSTISIASGTSSSGYLAFADGTTGTDRYSGQIQYNHSTNTMSFKTGGGVEAMTINSAQDVTVGSAGATGDFAVWTDGTSSTAAGFTVDASADEVIVGQLSAGGNTTFKVRNRLNNTVFSVLPDAPSTTVFAPNIATGSAGTLTVKTGSINSDSIRLEAGGTTSTWLESRGYLGHSWYVDSTRKATLDATGLGLGTDSPDGLLHLKDGNGTEPSFASDDYLIIQNNDDASDSARMTIISGTSGYGRIGFGDSGGRDRGRIAYNHADDSLGFGTNGSAATKLLLDSSGNLTLQTNQGADTALAIYNTNSGASAKASLKVGYDSSNHLHIYRAGNLAGIFYNATQSGSSHKFQIAGSTRLTILSGGDVGLGTESPEIRLSVTDTYNGSALTSNDIPAVQIINEQGSYTADNVLGVLGFGKSQGFASGVRAGMVAHYSGTGSQSSNVGAYLSFRTSADGAGDSTERLRILSSGNVGIGTSSPVALSNQTSLTVNGTSVGRLDLKAGGGGGGVIYGTGSEFAWAANSGLASNFYGASGQPMRYFIGSNEVASFTQSNGSGALTIKSNAGQDLVHIGPEGSGGTEEYGFIRGYKNGTQTWAFLNSGPSYINTGQNFGINTSSPGYTLVVDPVSTLGDGGFLAEFNATSNGLIIARYNCGSDNIRSGLYFENQGVVNARVWVDDSMNLRIQNSNPTANNSGTVVGTQTSDARLKEVFGPVTSSLDEVLKLNPVRYALKNENRERLGFIAQEVKEVLPQTVYDTMVSHEDDDDTLLAMEYVGIIPVLVNAIKELNNRIAALEAA